MAMDLTFVLKGYNLTNTQRVVYGVLEGLSRASAKKGLPYTYIGQKALAERVGVSPRTIYAALKRLKEVGLIMVKRRGQGRNNAIYVLSPSATKEERQVRQLICESRPAKCAKAYIKNQRLNNTIDKSISPVNDINAASPQDKGRTAKKGKPTNKQLRRSIEERQKIKKRYKDFLLQKLKVQELKDFIFSDGDEIQSIEKIIELISNTMSSKGKIMVNGSLLLPCQWWSVVKNISQETVLNLIYKLRTAKDIRNYRAYLLASLYNAALQETISRPWYNIAY